LIDVPKPIQGHFSSGAPWQPYPERLLRNEPALGFRLRDQAEAVRFLGHPSAVHSIAYRGLHDRRVWLPLVDVCIKREDLLDVELVLANIARHPWRYQIIQG
jgi:hypothetical protein